MTEGPVSVPGVPGAPHPGRPQPAPVESAKTAPVGEKAVSPASAPPGESAKPAGKAPETGSASGDTVKVPAETVKVPVPEGAKTNAPVPAASLGVPGGAPQVPQSVIPYLKALVESGGSDLHIKVGSQPRVRIDGRLRKLQAPILTDADTDHMTREVLRSDLVSAFDNHSEVDFAYSIEGVGRFRVNAFRQRGSVGLAFRRVAIGAQPIDELGLPPIVEQLAMESRGLILVTGPSGSGKTTTLAGMVDIINSKREVHIVTIEDPIEVLHFDKRGMVNQREIHVDTEDFNSALRAALRQDPDVILVGEMRDVETVKAAISAAETGHLVLSTLHTVDAQETVDRIIDFFPPHEQQQVRLSLAGALRGILCQRLVPRVGGKGRCVAMEVAINNGRIEEAIADPEKTSLITGLVAEGAFYGMQTFDQHLLALFRDGVITLEDALAASSKPHDLTVELKRLGLVQ